MIICMITQFVSFNYNIDIVLCNITLEIGNADYKMAKGHKR